MDRIKDQANTVSKLLLAPETGSTYKRALTLTWDILRETGLLLWLVVCLVFVGTDWFYNNSVKLGRNARAWYNSLGEKSEASTEQSLATTGQSILEVAKSGSAYLLSQARQQLGIPEPEAPVAPPAPKPAPTPAPKPAPVVVESPKPVATTVIEDPDEA